jgi:hypothetical protein
MMMMMKIVSYFSMILLIRNCRLEMSFGQRLPSLCEWLGSTLARVQSSLAKIRTLTVLRPDILWYFSLRNCLTVSLVPASLSSGSARNAFNDRVARCYIFKPKIPIWVKFGGSWNGKCCYILWPFGIFFHHLV